MKKLSILGSTGSIGTQTLEIVRTNKDLEICALAAGSNVSLLEAQIREFHPDMACLFDEAAAADLRVRVADLPVKVLSGMEGLMSCAAHEPADIVVGAIVGMVGIRPVMAAIEAGKTLALANKETLVTAGHLIIPLAKEHNVPILPVDSEHSAIFQVLQGNRMNKVSRILLTASGGPFRGLTRVQTADKKPKDALKHPNWSMGRKITIDSATMVNKGLEVMEAKWLFGVDYDDIEVVVQPKSIIHSMVEFEDGAVLAQLGTPDMKLPIAYALYYPERKPLPGPRLDFKTMGQIQIASPDNEAFPALPLAYRAGKTGGTMPTVYNAANEWAVAAFLAGKIGFNDITDIIAACMDRHAVIESPSLDTILEAERELRASLTKDRG
ncbi:MAG: 1-deoxy-D-xylulose-5-phosphate reductoisomerase [Lachnospiraceae bacterium]|nr:1-deoxy-D-xylulose-5-phosphate reductoisomerase [Lachnospiraceae bacterium]